MNEEDYERWRRLIEEARAGVSEGADCTAVPLDLLLKIDLELCAASALCGLRNKAAAPLNPP